MQPEAGVTVMAGEGVDDSLKPPRLTLDPFAPYVASYKQRQLDAAATPPPPSPPTAQFGRRKLQRADVVVPPPVRRTLASTPEARAATAQPARLRTAEEQTLAAQQSAAAFATRFAAMPRPAYDEELGPYLGAPHHALNATGGGRHLRQVNMGCASTNQCPIKPGIMPGGGNYANLAVTLAFPGFPLGLMFGPVSRAPCMYELSASVSPTQVLIPLPVTVTGALGVSLCSDLSSFDLLYGSLSVAVGIPGIPDKSPLSLLSWQIAGVGLSLVNEVQELHCVVDGSGNTGNVYFDPGDSRMLGDILTRFRTRDARNACLCLANTPFRNGIGFTVSGPDIPGLVLLSIPLVGTAVTPVAPFLPFIKLRPTASLVMYPFFCGMTRQDIDFVITVTLDLVFVREEYNIFDPAFNFMWAYPLPTSDPLNNGGTYTPGGLLGMEVPDWVSGSDAIVANIIDTFTAIANKLQNADIAWTQIVGASTDLKNAANTYFNSAAGATNPALTRIFKPVRVLLCSEGAPPLFA